MEMRSNLTKFSLSLFPLSPLPRLSVCVSLPPSPPLLLQSKPEPGAEGDDANAEGGGEEGGDMADMAEAAPAEGEIDPAL